MVRMLRFPLLACLVLAAALAAAPAAAFRNVAPGDAPANPAVTTTDGLVQPLLVTDGVSPTVVLFWATWSPRSAEALADLQQLYADRGVSVVAVNVDREGTDAERHAAVTRAARHVGYPVVLDPELDLYRRWGVVAVPSVALVGGDGRVVRTLDGYAPTQRRGFLGEAAAVAVASAGADAAPARRAN